MNKKWPKLKREDLINTKIHIKSEEQLKAFIAACLDCGFLSVIAEGLRDFSKDAANYRYLYRDCMTWGTTSGKFVDHKNKEIFFEPIEDEEAEYPNPPHKHRDSIIAWANGADIEFWSENPPRWIYADEPLWREYCEYRIKPKQPSEIERIEIEIRELSEKQKELADKLSKLKG